MAGGAELGALVRSGIGGAVVGKLTARAAKTLGARPGRGAEALMSTHVAGRAHDALALQRRIESRVGLEPGRGPDQGRLLGEWGMTDEAGACSRRIAPRQLDQLAGDAGPHAAGVNAASPVLVLGRMTGAAIPRSQQTLQGRERGRGRALGRDGHAPVTLQELLFGG